MILLFSFLEYYEYKKDTQEDPRHIRLCPQQARQPVPEVSRDEGWIVVACSVLLLPSGFISWAFLKVFVNISRSLYNINEKVAHIDNKVGPAEGSYTDLVK